jgi:RNA polymerase subunit RPABC4/transcription elongation factor Spt4
MINKPKIDACVECGVIGPLDKDNKCSVCGTTNNN